MPGLKTNLPTPGTFLPSVIKKGAAANHLKKGFSVAANIGPAASFDEALREERGGMLEGRRCGKGTQPVPDRWKGIHSQEKDAKDVSEAANLPVVMASPVVLGRSAGSVESRATSETPSADPAVRVPKFAAMKTEPDKTGISESVKGKRTGSESGERLKAPSIQGNSGLAAEDEKSFDPSPSLNASKGKAQLSVVQEDRPAAIANGKGEEIKTTEPLQNEPATQGREKAKEPAGSKDAWAARIQPEQDSRPKGEVSPWPSNVKDAGATESSSKDRTRNESRFEGKTAVEGASSALRGDHSKTQRSPADGNGSGEAGEKEIDWKTTFLSARNEGAEDAGRSKEKIFSYEKPVAKSEKAAVSAEQPDPLSGIKDAGDQKTPALRVLRSSAAETPVSQSLFERIAENSEMLARTGQNRVRLTLTPPQLGTLDLDLVVKQDQVRMVLTAENNDIRQVLQSNIEQLKTVLQGQGFDIDRLDVFVQDRGERENGMSRGEMSFGREHSGNKGDDGPRGEPLTDLPRRSYRDLLGGEEGISIFA